MRGILISLVLLAGSTPSALAAADPCEAPLPAAGASFSGKVSYVVDGDGLCVGTDRGGIEVRLSDFNAPTLDTPEGKAAKTALERIAMGKTVECVAERRSQDRVYAACTLDATRLGDLLRAAGVGEGGE